jgi:hypothetical protein
MNFELVIRQLQETQVLMAEIQLRQLDYQKVRAESVVYMKESMRVHEQRMAHIDMRLASITYKLGSLGGYFKRPN